MLFRSFICTNWAIEIKVDLLVNICVFDVSLFFCDVYIYASVNFNCAHAPPLANPQALAFFSLGWQIPRGGETLAAKCPAVGTKEEGTCPAPGIVRPQSTLQQFSFIAQ